MIVRSLDDLQAMGRHVVRPGAFESSRYLLREDGVGFTMTRVTLAAGTRQVLEYKHHVEANLVTDGEGVVVDVASGEEHPLSPGVMYTLDEHDRHELRCTTDMTVISVFLPALVGTETHDADGSYPLL